jgi:NAD(P)-dependent dehydrogenase (short-subunit alcohol dehydrogenase family)
VARSVLVVGGAGAFGRRLVEGLVRTTELDVVVAARDAARAAAAVAGLAPGRVSVIALHAATATADELRATAAFVAVDAAGPFQGADYHFARAAIEAGMHYLDLADGRDFVAGFAALDAKARAAGIVALSGASSTPALSHAALDRLVSGWRRIDTVEIAISPGNHSSPRGLSVMRAILSYAGRPVRVFDRGGWMTRPGWGMTVRRSLPGLGRRYLSLCETPDLDLVPQRFSPRNSALFRAGLELPPLHLGLVAASLLVRARLLRSLVPFARPFRWIGARLGRFGSDRGGMVVAATGIDGTGAATHAEWSLVAEAGDGPAIPTLPALAAIRALADGTLGRDSGAGACVGVLDLDMIAREFAGYRIETKTTMRAAASPSPFQALLGADFARLPVPVRRLHCLSADETTAGRAEITGPPGPMARLIRWVSGLPQPGSDVPVTVAFRIDGKGGEYWRRRFARRRYASIFAAGYGRHAGTLLERFFPFQLYHRLAPSADGLAWTLVAWKLLGIPLPRWSMPDVNCFESADGDRFVFDIDVVFPFVGPVVHYRGWLLPQDRERS